MSELIEAMAKKTNTDWFVILSALRDRSIVNATQVKEIEDYFYRSGN